MWRSPCLLSIIFQPVHFFYSADLCLQRRASQIDSRALTVHIFVNTFVPSHPRSFFFLSFSLSVTRLVCLSLMRAHALFLPQSACFSLSRSRSLSRAVFPPP